MEKVQRPALRQGVDPSGSKWEAPHQVKLEVKRWSVLHAKHAALRVMARGWKSRATLNNKFDGDMMSFISMLTEDSKEEIRSLLDSRDYYVGISGKVNYSTQDDNTRLVFLELSK